MFLQILKTFVPLLLRTFEPKQNNNYENSLQNCIKI